MIEPRRYFLLPIGLHPMSRLPAEPGSVAVDVGGDQSIMTFPGRLTARSHSRPNGLGPLDKLALDDGTTIDGRSLPLNYRALEVAQVLQAGGTFALRYRDEHYKVRL
jgi:hypothetical protein